MLLSLWALSLMDSFVPLVGGVCFAWVKGTVGRQWRVRKREKWSFLAYPSSSKWWKGLVWKEIFLSSMWGPQWSFLILEHNPHVGFWHNLTSTPRCHSPLTILISGPTLLWSCVLPCYHVGYLDASLMFVWRGCKRVLPGWEIGFYEW